MKGCNQLSYTSTVDSYNSNFQSLQVSLMILTDILTVSIPQKCCCVSKNIWINSGMIIGLYPKTLAEGKRLVSPSKGLGLVFI